jgi:RNA polymerase sigma-70 factor (ECF subfamily)
MITEAALVTLMKGKSRSAFANLYDSYAAALWGLILKLTPDQGLATEILKDSFINMEEKRNEYEHSKVKLFSWMVGITLNQCVKRLSMSRTEVMVKLNSVTGQSNEQL